MYIDRVFAVIDLETTNNPHRNNRHEIIEMAALLIEKEKITDKIFYSLVKPPCNVQPRNMEVTGIDDKMLANEKSLDEVLPLFLDFIKDSVLIGHNVSFDLRVLNDNLIYPTYRKLENKIVDTMILSRKIFPENASHNLDSLLQSLSIQSTDRHRALGDVKLTAEAFVKIIGILKENNVDRLSKMNQLCEKNSKLGDFRQLKMF